MSDKLRIAWFSDLPNGAGISKTVSAYVSALLLPLLRDRFEIELFHNSFESYADYSVHHCLTALHRHRENPFDLFFYQLEDTPQTQWVRIHCGLMPGIQLSHDYLFTSYGPEPILNSPWHTIVRSLDSGVTRWPDRLDEQYQNGPHGIRESAYAAVRLFSQPGMVSESTRLAECSVVADGKVPSAYLPLPVTEKIFNCMPKKNRRILFCGSPWVQDRVHKVFGAVARYDSNLPVVWLIDPSEQEKAEEIMREFSLNSVSLEIGRTVAHWQELVAGGGLALHTLFSVFGQTGPYLAVSFAAGLTCVSTRFGHSEMLPDQVVFKIQAGETESAELTGVFEAYFDEGIGPDPLLVKEFAREQYDARLVAEELALVFTEHRELVAETMERWDGLKEIARRQLLKEAREIRPAGEDLLDASTCVENVYKEFQWAQ